MKQVTFAFEDDPPTPPELHFESQQEQQLVEWMAQAIVSVFVSVVQSTEGDEHDEF